MHETLTKEELFSHLSPHLFWDIDKAQFDFERHAGQLIARVLEYGEFEDWRFVRDYYGLERIVAECRQLRTLDPKALYYVAAVSHTDPTTYRCYATKPWLPQP